MNRPRPQRLISRGVTAVFTLALLAFSAGCGSTVVAPPRGLPSAGSASQYTAIQNSVNQSKTKTFKAVYTTTSSGGGGPQTTTTIEQKPPSSLFASGTSEVITTASTTYVCTIDTTGTTCNQVPAAGNPEASVAQVYSGTYVLTLMQAYQNQPALAAAGVNVAYSNATYAGQASTCMTVSGATGNEKWCVTNDGILAYSGGGGSASTGAFELTSYTTNVPDSDFAIPTNSSASPSPSDTPSDTSGATPSPSDAVPTNQAGEPMTPSPT